MAETTNVSKLIINYLTEDQYKTAKASGLINENELYVTDVQDSTTLDCFEELFTATEGQTLFTLTEGTYQVGESRLTICVNGAQQPSTAYTETSSSSFTFVSGLHAGDSVIARYFNSRITSNITLDGTNIVITGYSKPASKTPLVATDRVDEALGKLEAGVDINTASISELNADIDFPVTNLITGGDFPSTAGWTPYNGAPSASNNVYSLTGNGASAYVYAMQSTGTDIIPNHKYFARGVLRVTNNACSKIYFELNGSTGGAALNTTVLSPIRNQQYTISTVFTSTNQTGKVRLSLVSQYADASTASGKVMEAKYVLVIDLTAVFCNNVAGTGNEPTAAQMDALLSMFSNSWFNGTSNIAKGQYMAKRAIESYFPITNLVTNSDFSNGTTGWTTFGATISALNNILTVTNNATPDNRYPYVFQNSQTPCVAGHKIYQRALVKVTNSTCESIRLTVEGSAGVLTTAIIYSPLINQQYLLTGISTLTSGTTGNVRTWIYQYYADIATAASKVMEVQYILTIDLTAAFGAGNEPTAAEMNAILAFYPNSWFDGTVNLASNPKMLPYLLNNIRNLNLEKTSYGVYSGLGVTAQSTPDMTVNVATGTIYMANGTRFTPTANTALAITAADATNPRIDIVYVNSTGVISYLAGTAAASPSAPTVPTGTDGQKLAEINVAANATTITSTAIADRRKTLYTEAEITPTLLNNYTGTLRFIKFASGLVCVEIYLVAGTTAPLTNIATVPTGYKPSLNILPAIPCNVTTNNSTCYLRITDTIQFVTGAATGNTIRGSFCYYATR